MTTEQLYQLFVKNPSAETDTRKLKEGDIFFALSGPNFNGNQFAPGMMANFEVINQSVAYDESKMEKVHAGHM